MSHPEALEVLYWHDMYATSQPERSDDSFLSLRKLELVEKRPALLNMSDTEIGDWTEEMRPLIEWQNEDDGVFVTIPEIGRTFAKTLREAICRAASKWKELNDAI